MDFLSDIPLSIIHVILSRVPIRDAIRTSILSRKWRYTWSSLPNLSFDCQCVNPPMGYDSDGYMLNHFISQTLLLHEGPVLKFKLFVPPMVNPSECINQWLLFLSRNGIRNLDLVSDIMASMIKVHSTLYSCKSLTNLKLHVYSIPALPTSFKGFLFLKSLDIHMHEVDTRLIESIVAHSPLLEELALYGFEYLKMTICAPKLKYLHVCSIWYDLDWRTPLLPELKSFDIGVESLAFPHLRTIELSYVPFYNKEVTPAIIRLIKGSPNLHQLKISGFISSADDELEPDYFWDIKPAQDFTCDSLKVIKIKRSVGYIDELKLIEFLLARSPVLEILMYEAFASVSDNKLQKITTRLLRYRRASAKAQIVISEKRTRH